MPQWLVIPANSVLVGGPHDILECEVGANATAAKMLPKRVVIYDAADGAVKESGDEADDVIGVLMEAADKTITTAYAVGDQCKVVRRGKVVVVAASGGSAVVMGDWIVAAADGKVKKLAVGAMGAQGSIIGQVLVGADPAAADKDIIIDLDIQGENAAAA